MVEIVIVEGTTSYAAGNRRAHVVVSGSKSVGSVVVVVVVVVVDVRAVGMGNGIMAELTMPT